MILAEIPFFAQVLGIAVLVVLGLIIAVGLIYSTLYRKVKKGKICCSNIY